MARVKRYLLPVVGGGAGSLMLGGIYFGIVSLAEKLDQTLELFGEHRWVVMYRFLGCGSRAGLKNGHERQLLIWEQDLRSSGALTGGERPAWVGDGCAARPFSSAEPR